MDSSQNVPKAAWKPAFRRSDKEVEDDESEKLLKDARGMLNKITPEKFKILKLRFLKLEIKNETQLKGVIALILAQVGQQPKFSMLYSQICESMQHLNVPGDRNANGRVNFLKVLLSQCRLFLKNPPKINQNSDTYLTETEMENKMKDMYHGTVKFVGELYNIGCLSDESVHSFIGWLFRDIESLVVFLTTIGRSFDATGKTIHQKLRIDSYFDRLDGIVYDGNTVPRIRFLVVELLELRERGWSIKRDETPKTLDGIRIEVAMKKQAEENAGDFLMSEGYNANRHRTYDEDKTYEEVKFDPEEIKRLAQRIKDMTVNPDTFFWPHFMKNPKVPESTGWKLKYGCKV